MLAGPACGNYFSSDRHKSAKGIFRPPIMVKNAGFFWPFWGGFLGTKSAKNTFPPRLAGGILSSRAVGALRTGGPIGALRTRGPAGPFFQQNVVQNGQTPRLLKQTPVHGGRPAPNGQAGRKARLASKGKARGSEADAASQSQGRSSSRKGPPPAGSRTSLASSPRAEDKVQCIMSYGLAARAGRESGGRRNAWPPWRSQAGSKRGQIWPKWS